MLAKKVRIIARESEESKNLKKNTLLGFFAKRKKIKASRERLDPIAPDNSDFNVTESSLVSEDKVAEGRSNSRTEDAQGVEHEVQKLRLSKRQKRQMLGLLRQRKTHDSEIQLQNKIEFDRLDLINHPVMRLDFDSRELSKEDDDLWHDTFCELVAVSAAINRGAAIPVSTFINSESQSVLSVYFELAFEELAYPGKKRDYIDKLGSRKIEAIESEDLKNAIGLYQQDTERIASLEGLDSDLSPKMIAGVTVSMSTRLLSWILDVCISFVLSFLIGLLLYCWKSSVVSDLLLGQTTLTLSDFYSAAIYTFPTFYIILLFIFPIARSIVGVTVGEFLTKIKLYSLDTTRLAITKSIAWTLFSIFTISSLGLGEIRRGEHLLWREKILGARLLRT